MNGQNIRIRLKAFDHRVLDASTKEIVSTAKRTGAQIRGPIPLPTQIEKFTVNRSPHIDKKSREQFEMRTHKRVLDIVEWDVPVSYKAVVDGFNEVYHAIELHHVGTDWQKAARGLTMHVVNDHNYLCYVPRHQYLEQLAETWDHHKYAICHYVVFPNTVFNCNPDHIQVFNPIPIEVDRTRFLCWQLYYPGDVADADYAVYYDRMMAHWKVLQGVVGEDISIYEQLKRTKRSSGYTEHRLNSREFKLHHYHNTMAEMIKD